MASADTPTGYVTGEFTAEATGPSHAESVISAPISDDVEPFAIQNGYIVNKIVQLGTLSLSSSDTATSLAGHETSDVYLHIRHPVGTSRKSFTMAIEFSSTSPSSDDANTYVLLYRLAEGIVYLDNRSALNNLRTFLG